jgi:hypothetical protein
MNKRGLVGVLVAVVVVAAAGYYYFVDSDDAYDTAPSDEGCLNARELFATEAEALEYAEKIGCTGSHMHSNYAKPYMACIDHEQPVDESVVC